MKTRHVGIRPTIVLILCVTLIAGQPSGLIAAEPVDPVSVLDKRVKSYSITGTLSQAVGQIEKLGGVQCDVDWQVMEEVGLKRQTPVSVIGEDVKFSQVIDLMLLQLKKRTKNHKPLAWCVRNEVILITTQDNIMNGRVLPNLRSGKLDQLPTSRSVKSQTSQAWEGFNFKDTPLSEVVETFRKITGVNFHVNWRALESVGIDKDTEISFQAKDISVARALDLTMAQLNADKGKYDSIYWVVDGNVVEISTGAVLDRTMRTQIYEAADLLFVTQNHPGTRVETSVISSSVNTSTGGGNSGDKLWNEEDEKDEKDRRKSMRELREETSQSLITIIKNTIGDDMWRPQGKGSVRIHNKKIIITQSLLGFKLMEQSFRK